MQEIARAKVAHLGAPPAVLERLAQFVAVAARARFEVVRDKASADQHQAIEPYLRKKPRTER